MTEFETKRKERKMGAQTQKIEHKDVRVILNPEKAAQAPPDVKKEGKLIDWAEALHENAMLIAAAGVLASEGSLEKCASVLWWAGFPVPAGHFPEGHEGNDYFPNDEEALRLWVEGEAERPLGALGTVGFHLAVTGTLMDEARDDLEAGDLILKPGVIEALGIDPKDLVRATLEDEAGALIAVPDARTGEPIPMPLREMDADDHRRVHEAVEARIIEHERMEKLTGDLACRMEEAGCGPGVTEFLAGEVEGKAAGEPETVAKATVSEKEFQAQVLDLARLSGWLCYHTHDPRRSAPASRTSLWSGRPWFSSRSSRRKRARSGRSNAAG